jgi:hypothetical protein
MSDVFIGYRNFLSGTLDVVVHEWAPNLNIGMENLSFHVVGISIMMHCCPPYTLFYVLMTRVLF